MELKDLYTKIGMLTVQIDLLQVELAKLREDQKATDGPKT